MQQLDFTVEQQHCSGFDWEPFVLFIDTSKTAVFDGNLCKVGCIVGDKLFASNCKRKANKLICLECEHFQTLLSSKLTTSQQIIHDCLNGKLPHSNQFKQYPNLMYSIIKQAVNKLRDNLLDETEQTLIQSYRNAKSSYETDWKDYSDGMVEKQHKKQDHHLEKQQQHPEKPVEQVSVEQLPKKRKTHNPSKEHPPPVAMKMKPFEETFLFQFISNQLVNYSKPVHQHTYSETDKRFWLLVKYFSGKTLFERIFGNRNKQVPVNHFNHLQYNLIVPEYSTIKLWTPKESIGKNPNIEYVFQSVGSKCKDVCISVDGMKILHKLDWMNDSIVGLNTQITSDYFNNLNNFKLEDVSDEMLLFHINSIDNSWCAPLGWFSVSKKKINFNRFIIRTLKEFIPTLQKYNLNLVCGCADGEIDAPFIQNSIQKIIPAIIFLTDYVHNFKNQRNCLFARPILTQKVNMSTLINCMILDDRLYQKLDKDDVSPTDIMALDPCLNITHPEVISILMEKDDIKVKELVKYLQEIRKLYDIINNNSPNISIELEKSKTYFSSLKNYSGKTKQICLHTIEGFQALIKNYKSVIKPSAITTNDNELIFSVVRRKYPRPTVKQFCKSLNVSFYVLLVMHASNDVRGFSLANIPLTNHYYGMNVEITTLPKISDLNHSQISTINKSIINSITNELSNINKNIEGHVRKTTLRLESCPPRKLYISCPILGCDQQKPYVRKGNFVNHLRNIHNKSMEEAIALTKKIECEQFDKQYKLDYVERRKNAQINSEFGLDDDELSHESEYSQNNMSQDNVYIENELTESQSNHSIMEQLYSSETFKQNKAPKFVMSQYLNKIEIKQNIDDLDITQVQPHNGVHFVIIDVETTGFSSITDELIQISIYSLSTKLLHSIYIQPTHYNWYPQIKKLHSNKIEMLHHAPVLSEVADQIVNYLTKNNTCKTVALVHSTGLDKNFITKALEIEDITFLNTMSKFFLERKALDTLYHKTFPKELMIDDDCLAIPHDAAFDVVSLYDLLIFRWKTDQKIISRCQNHTLMKTFGTKQLSIEQFF